VIVGRRIIETAEKLVWLIFASIIGGTWVLYEPITGRPIPDYAHPVFAAIMGTALVWAGLDHRKINQWHRRLLALPPEAAVSPDEADRLAPKIAALESEDPMLIKAIQAAALREAGYAAKRPKTKSGSNKTVGGTTRPRNLRKTPPPVDLPREG
jgi:hypothetical protein